MSLNSTPFSLGDQIHTTHIKWLGEKIAQDPYQTDSRLQIAMNLDSRIWADETRWTSFHAACWHALRNDTWTGLPFSPKRLGKREYFSGYASMSESTFGSILAGYSALADLLALGGMWRNPAHSFEEWQWGPGHNKDNFSMGFLRFWLPMLNTYAEWFSQQEFPQHNLPYRPIVLDRHYALQLDYPDTDVLLESSINEYGGTDPLHLTSHTGHPFCLEPEARFTREGSSSYVIMTSESYAGWARSLLETVVRDATLIRVDVRVHESMEQLTTLGHLLLTPGYTESRDGSGFPVAIRYLNDQQAIEYASWRGLL